MLDKLIKFFVYETKGYITKTQLVKFVYLADLYSVKWTGKQLTDLDWCYYYYGPWNEEIDKILNQMEGKELIQESQGNTILIKPNPQVTNIEDLDLSIGIKLMLDNIRREWAGITSDKVKQLLDYVYNTEPMRLVKNQHKPEEKFPLNLQSEREKVMGELG
jgi:hypothetical protein